VLRCLRHSLQGRCVKGTDFGGGGVVLPGPASAAVIVVWVWGLAHTWTPGFGGVVGWWGSMAALGGTCINDRLRSFIDYSVGGGGVSLTQCVTRWRHSPAVGNTSHQQACLRQQGV
jgi:hypothetical protein